MAKSRTELMVDRLRDLQTGTPDIEASAVVSVDGLIMASSLPAGVEEDRVSAMSAAMLSLASVSPASLGAVYWIRFTFGRQRICDSHVGRRRSRPDRARPRERQARVGLSGYEARSRRLEKLV